MIEIEKTFLIKKIPQKLSSYKSVTIRQGYISSTPSPLRIRQKGDKYELTKKIPLKDGDFSSVNEINIPLTKEEFNKLWTLIEKSLEKIRYLVPIKDNLVAELDVYQKDLKGFSGVEVEFVSKKQMNAFIPPEWFGADITQKDFSANSFLAGKSFSDIEKHLRKLN